MSGRPILYIQESDYCSDNKVSTFQEDNLTLSKLNVLVSANDHPASKPRLIIAELVVGVAEASPNGFSK